MTHFCGVLSAECQEVLNWDAGHFGGAGKVVFEEPTWKETWEPMMRADFKLFDELLGSKNSTQLEDVGAQIVFQVSEIPELLGFRVGPRYKFKHAGAPKFDFPLHCWWCEGEHFIKGEMVQAWKDWTSADFDYQVLKDLILRRYRSGWLIWGQVIR